MRNFQGTAQELQSLKEKAEDKARMDLEADQRRVAAMGTQTRERARLLSRVFEVLHRALN